jgi:hypothetical protein
MKLMANHKKKIPYRPVSKRKSFGRVILTSGNKGVKKRMSDKAKRKIRFDLFNMFDCDGC